MSRGLEDRLAVEKLPVGRWLDYRSLAFYFKLAPSTSHAKARQLARDGLLEERLQIAGNNTYRRWRRKR